MNRFSRFRAWHFAFVLAAWNSNAPADVAGAWQLAGTLKVSASVQGKSAQARETTLGAYVAHFAPDGSFRLSGGAFELSGAWRQSRSGFQATLEPASLRAWLRGFEQASTARSGELAFMEAKQASFMGTERSDGSLKGALTLEATLFFSAYGNRQGSLRLSFSFTGARAAP
jgi:hypothetical protein